MARLIKRYDNRKLYDTEASSYVSQRDIAQMVRRGETVRILDNSTGEDLTAQTLTQIILEEGKETGSLLPTEMLHGLLRRGSQALDQAFGQALDQGARQMGQGLSQVKSSLNDLLQQSFSRLNRLTHGSGGARSSEVDALHDQLAHLEARLADVLDRIEDDQPEDDQPEDDQPEDDQPEDDQPEDDQPEDDQPDGERRTADGTKTPAKEKPAASEPTPANEP